MGNPWTDCPREPQTEIMAKTILVVDDSVTIRTAIRWIAEGAGHRVLEASSVQEARNALAQDDPNILFIDYHLPDGKGVDLCSELRNDGFHTQLPIFILFGEAHPFDKDDARNAQANGILRKPFRSDKLLELVDQDPVAIAVPRAPAAPAPSAPSAVPPRAPMPPAAPAAPPAAPPAPPVEELSDADLIEEDNVTSAPPTPPRPGRRQASKSGAFRTVPMPGSGLHRLPPPGGQSIQTAGTGLRPRSPSGRFAAISADVPSAPVDETPIPSAAPTGATTIAMPETAQAVPEPSTPIEVPASAVRQSDATAEVNVLDDSDIVDTGSLQLPKSDADKTYTVTEAQLRELVDARTTAIVEELLPGIARKALANLLHTELNEQVIKLGVTKRVQKFLDQDLPAYAQSAVDKRLRDQSGQ